MCSANMGEGGESGAGAGVGWGGAQRGAAGEGGSARTTPGIAGVAASPSPPRVTARGCGSHRGGLISAGRCPRGGRPEQEGTPVLLGPPSLGSRQASPPGPSAGGLAGWVKLRLFPHFFCSSPGLAPRLPVPPRPVPPRPGSAAAPVPLVPAVPGPGAAFGNGRTHTGAVAGSGGSRLANYSPGEPLRSPAPGTPGGSRAPVAPPPTHPPTQPAGALLLGWEGARGLLLPPARTCRGAVGVWRGW